MSLEDAEPNHPGPYSGPRKALVAKCLTGFCPFAFSTALRVFRNPRRRTLNLVLGDPRNFFLGPQDTARMDVMAIGLL